MAVRSAAPLSIAVAGAGMIGRRHAAQIAAASSARLHALVDPDPAARALAHAFGVPWQPSIAAMLDEGRPDGLVVATPNRLHVEHGLAAVAAGVPALIEKPFAHDLDAGLRLVEAAEARGVPLLTGHHRRHNPVIRRARDIVASGRLGRIVTAHAFFWLMKPDDYFETPWRRAPGAGPVLLNLIHDIDLMRHLVGEVAAVQAFQSSAVRGHPVDETTAVSLRFAGGALGTLNISDTVVSPWSWEHTSGENPAYPRTDQTCLFIGGTHGSLAVPSLAAWSNEGVRGWWEPFRVERGVAADQDPLANQIAQFCRVIRGEEAPLCSGRDGLRTLAAVAAIQQAADLGRTVEVRPV